MYNETPFNIPLRVVFIINGNMSDSPGYFEKQRDVLIQEIGLSIESVVYNLDILNRSLNGSISVGKEFDNVGRLWSHFYDGLNQLKERGGNSEEEQQDSDVGSNEEHNSEQADGSENEANNTDTNATANEPK